MRSFLTGVWRLPGLALLWLLPCSPALAQQQFSGVPPEPLPTLPPLFHRPTAARVVPASFVADNDRPDGYSIDSSELLSSVSQEPPANTLNSLHRQTGFNIHSPPPANSLALRTIPQSPLSLRQRIILDHTNYYSPQNLLFLGGCFAAGGIMANTRIDTEINERFGKSIRGSSNDEWFETFHAPKELGNGLYTLPVFAAAWGVGSLLDDTQLGYTSATWGNRSLRGFLVGAPPIMLMQKVLGAGRPEEGDSNWSFWADNNGVSGHSFMGSLPFLTAAHMTDRPLPKFGWYVASTIVPLSRVNDGDHYASQALLGWCMALSATLAVEAADYGSNRWTTVPIISSNYAGIGFQTTW